MPTDQGRRHPQHHFGGFLGLALHRAKSKSSEHLHPGSQHKKLDKRVHSSKDLASGAVGFDNVLAELNQQPKFRKSQEEIRSPGPAERPRSKKPQKQCTGDTLPFSTKYSISKDTTTKLAIMSVAVTSQPQGNSMNGSGDPDMLDQAFNNIRTKLKEMSSERTSIETRIEELEDGLETAYYQYRIQHPDSQPLPLFPAFTPFTVTPASTEEVDGLKSESSESSSRLSNGGSPVTSITSLPSDLQHTPHFRQRGERFMTITKHTWQPPMSDMVDSTENSAPPTRADAGSPHMSSSLSSNSIPGSPLQPYGATHHLLNTTPPSSPRAEQRTSAPLTKLTRLSQSAHTLSSIPTAKGGLAHARCLFPNPASPPRAHALSTTTKALSRSLNSSPVTRGFSTSQLAPLRERFYDKGGQLSHRNSLPDSLITTTIFEGTTSGANNKFNTTQTKPQFPGFRRRSSSSGNFDHSSKSHSSKSQLLVKKTSVCDFTKTQELSSNTSGPKQDYAWFEDF